MPEDQALDRLREILARPEYQVDRSVPWWQQLLGPVVDLIWSLVVRVYTTAVDAATGREGIFGWAVIALCVGLAVAAIIYLVRAVRLSVVRETRVGAASLAQRRERSDQLWRAAQQLAAAGQLADAVRLAYLSALYALDERALLHVETALTNREHAQRLRTFHPSVADGFTRLVEDYDRVRYGGAPVAPSTFEDFSRHVERVRASAFAGSAA
jgi:hypothetical protein